MYGTVPFRTSSRESLCNILREQTALSKRKEPNQLSVQGCQIFLGTTYQNGKNVPNNHKIDQIVT
jgi:hypothetical protein